MGASTDDTAGVARSESSVDGGRDANANDGADAAAAAATDSGASATDPAVGDGLPTTFAPAVAPSELASAVVDAHSVKLVVRPTGDTVAAAAILCAAFDALDIPFHFTAVHTAEEASRAVASVARDTSVVGIGTRIPDGTDRRPPPTADDSTEESGATVEGASPTAVSGPAGGEPSADPDVAENPDPAADDRGGEPDAGEGHAEAVEQTGVRIGAAVRDVLERERDGDEPPRPRHAPEPRPGSFSGEGATGDGGRETSETGDTGPEAEAESTAGGAGNAPSPTVTASEADPRRDEHPAARGVLMVTERVERSAVGTDPRAVASSPSPRDADGGGDGTGGGGDTRGETTTPADPGRRDGGDSGRVDDRGDESDRPARSWDVEREAAASAARTADRAHPTETDADGTTIKPFAPPEPASNRDGRPNGGQAGTAAAAAAAVAGRETTTDGDGAEPERDTDRDADDGGDTDADADDEVDAGEVSDSGRATATRFMTDGGTVGATGETAAPVVRADLDGPGESGDRERGSAALHAAATVEAMREAVDDDRMPSRANAASALAGMLTAEGGRNGAFDIGDEETWPTGFGATSLCRRVRADGLESAPGIGTPHSSTPEALRHTTFVHAGFNASSAAVGELLRDCPRVDVRAEDCDADAWEQFVETTRRRIERETERGIGDGTRTELLFGRHRFDDGRCETIEGLADVLDTLARNGASGRAFALAFGTDPATGDDMPLDAWAERSERVHARVAAADRVGDARVDGLEDDTAAETTVFELPEATAEEIGHPALLLHRHRSATPVTVCLGSDTATAIRSPGSSTATEANDDGSPSAREVLVALTGRPAHAICGSRHVGRVRADGDGDGRGD